MAQVAKEIGFLWAFCVSCLFINADERGKRFLVDFHNFGWQNCESLTEYKELLALENDGHCHSFDSVIHKLRDLHARYGYSGVHCMHEVIGKLKAYYSSHHNTSGRCKCSGHVAYHPETSSKDPSMCTNRDHGFEALHAQLFGRDNTTGPCLLHDKVWVKLGSLPVHLSRDCEWEIINHYNTIFDANGPKCNCTHETMHVNETLSHTVLMTSTALAHTILPTALKESTFITTINPTIPESVSTITETMHVNETLSHTVLMTSTALAHTTATTALKESTFITTVNPTITESVPTITASVRYTCTKVTTISILAYGVQQSNPNAGNCHLESNDHQAPEALVLNMCNVSSVPETWTSGQKVMSVCASIPLYTPVATFVDGKYHSQGGHAGIFIGCLLDGFKIIVQECDKNITVEHVTTGHQPDPVNYFIIM